MYKIISDSACDLSKEYVEKNDITVVPFSVSFDQEHYLKDSIDITRDEFYTRLVNENVFPKSSLPSVEEYMDTFLEYVKQDIPVICLTISLVLSGSYNSARTAADLIKEDYPDAKIAVFDSKQNTVTQALLVNEIVKMKNDGLSFEESVEKIDKLIPTAIIFFTVGSLDYLRIGGRIGKLASIATGKLGIKPIILLKNGELGLGGIGRSRAKLKKAVLDTVNKHFTDNNLSKDDYNFNVGWGYDKEEGVEFLTLHNPIEYIADEQGCVKQVILQKMELGEPDASGRRSPVAIQGATETIDIDLAIVSVGVSPNPIVPSSIKGLELGRKGTITVDDNMESSIPMIYAGGDIVRGGATVILAMGDGRKAAAAMNEQLKANAGN